MAMDRNSALTPQSPDPKANSPLEILTLYLTCWHLVRTRISDSLTLGRTHHAELPLETVTSEYACVTLRHDQLSFRWWTNLRGSNS